MTWLFITILVFASLDNKGKVHVTITPLPKREICTKALEMWEEKTAGPLVSNYAGFCIPEHRNSQKKGRRGV